ncbi:MAG: YggT family protein [Desulfomicrobium sp.]|jgi:YggT family protein|nr:YggT family protein [Desulfomicrobium sp.]NLV96746.1 YggT family protein [Desulfovibrionales bacterium]
MPVFSSLLAAVFDVLYSILSLYFWVVIAAVVMSWINPDPYNPIVRAIRTLTEPVFYRIRRWLPFTYVSGIDFSPFLVVLAIKFVQVFLARLMMQIT